MSAVLLNGRPARDFELDAIEDGHQCERDRDLAWLAGVLSTDDRRPPERPPRPVTDILWGFA